MGPKKDPKNEGEKENSKKARWICKICGKSYLAKAYLRDHVKIVHMKIKDFKCDECNKTFGYSKDLKSHKLNICGREKQGVIKSLDCTICDKQFTSRSGLWGHMKMIHEGFSKRFKCEVCDKTFGYAKDIKRHKRYVCGQEKQRLDRSDLCSLCGKVFKQNKTLKAHIWAVHEDRRFQCDKCGKLFKYTQHLSKHKSRQQCLNPKEEPEVQDVNDIGTKSWMCSLCGEQFSDETSLLNHEKETHFEIMKTEPLETASVLN